MNLIELFIIGVGLSMDAFAVSVCKGLSTRKLRSSNYLTVGVYFGGFQALMPLIGYYLGYYFKNIIMDFDHWIAFILLAFIGVNMIMESTSIDALAIGVTFAFLNVNIFLAISIIGCTTFVLSMIGLKVGNIFGKKYKQRAELVGGIILVLMGIKILLEHLGIL